MVVTSEPCRLSTVVTQDRVATPSTCTVQAPHWAMPQPNLVPVMPSTSRSTQSSGVSSSTSTLWVLPLILMVKAMLSSNVGARIRCHIRCLDDEAAEAADRLYEGVGNTFAGSADTRLSGRRFGRRRHGGSHR